MSDSNEAQSNSGQVEGRATLFYVGTSFVLLGCAVGVFAGLSRSPIVGVLLPLLFGLIVGANGLYLAQADLSKAQDRYRLSLVGVMTSLFLLFVFVGVFYGILVRTGNGISALIPRFNTPDTKSQAAELPDVATMEANSSLQLALLRFRLRSLGASMDEQMAILKMAHGELSSLNVEELTIFKQLLSLVQQTNDLLNQESLDEQSLNKVKKLALFLERTANHYQYVADQLLSRKGIAEDFAALIKADKTMLLELTNLSASDFDSEESTEFANWLLSSPEIRVKLWELEVAYSDMDARLGHQDWLFGKSLSETVDELIKAESDSDLSASGSQAAGNLNMGVDLGY